MGKAEQAESVSVAANTLRAAEILRNGGVVAFPTETVYGLGADASNSAAVRRVFQIKGRPATNPTIVHVADIESARRCVSVWPEAAQRLAERFWPGPLTIVLPKADAIVPEVTAGGPTVGVRVPDHPVALAMLREFAQMGSLRASLPPALRGNAATRDNARIGVGVAAPSANRSAHVSPTTAQHVRDDLGDAVNLVLDGGPCAVGIESTVISLAMPAPTVLRPGGVSLEQLREVLGEVEVRGGSDVGAAASPGRQERHYAPRARAIAFTNDQRGSVPADGRNTGIVVLSPLAITEPAELGTLIAMPTKPQLYAEHLYRVLRALDAKQVGEIWIELPPDEPRWNAVRDRILRASSKTH